MGKYKHDEKKPGHPHHDGHDGRDVETLNGIVRNYNFSPRGGVEGILLREGSRTVQVNVPPDAWPFVAQAAAIGQAVQFAAVLELETSKHHRGEHLVYRLVSLDSATGPLPEEQVKVEGTVVRYNFARHGEANGVVLDNGDFVHLKPDGMSKVSLRVGQVVAAEGTARPMLMGHRAIEAEVVNGITLGPAGPQH